MQHIIPIRLQAIRGAAILAAAALFLSLSPIGGSSALAAGDRGGDHGGARDQVGQANSSTDMSSTGNPSSMQTYSTAPCQSCGMGSGMAGTVSYAPYSFQETPRCQTCTKGS